MEAKSFCNILIEVLTPLILHVCLYSLPFQASFLAHWHISDQIIALDAVARQVSGTNERNLHVLHIQYFNIYVFFESKGEQRTVPPTGFTIFLPA